MFQPPRTVLEIGEGGGMDLLSSWKEERYYFIALLLLVHKYKKKKKKPFLSVQEISRRFIPRTRKKQKQREKLK